MREADVIERKRALKFDPDPEEMFMSDLDQYRDYIENLPKYRPPTTTLEPTFYSTYAGQKEAYICSTCRKLIPKQYAKDYSFCPGCGLRIMLGLNNKSREE